MDDLFKWALAYIYTLDYVFLCKGNEIFYASLYLLHFTWGPLYMFPVIAMLTFPVAVAKSGIALLQGYLAAQNIAAVDTRERNEAKKE